MSGAHIDHLLAQVRQLHENHAELTAFCPFADDLIAQNITPNWIKSAAYLAEETELFCEQYQGLRDAFMAVSPYMCWRETYKGTNIEQDFLDRFGCYCLIGAGGAFHSAQMAAYLVYMPKQLYYPWHHHPGEEIYMVIAGEAEFMRRGEKSIYLGEGEICAHLSNQPHAMRTHDHPVMSYVVWRNGFDTPPVWTELT